MFIPVGPLSRDDDPDIDTVYNNVPLLDFRVGWNVLWDL